MDPRGRSLASQREESCLASERERERERARGRTSIAQPLGYVSERSSIRGSLMYMSTEYPDEASSHCLADGSGWWCGVWEEARVREGVGGREGGKEGGREGWGAAGSREERERERRKGRERERE